MKNLCRIATMLGMLFVTSISAKVVRVTDEEQYNREALAKNKRVLVEFSADWCSVCNGIQRPLEEIATEDEFGDISFVQVDVDKVDSVSKKNGIVGVPTFVYLENGNKKVEEIGVQNMPSFKDHLRKNLRKTFQVAENNDQMQGAQNGDVVEEVTVEEVDETMVPAQQPEQQGMLMNIVGGIKNFVMMIVNKVIGFFMTIINAIKGFFA